MSNSGHPTDHDLVHSDGATRLSLWWKEVPSLSGERAGIVGQFHGSSAQATHELLREAEAILRGQQCAVAIGPMNQNTWFAYRFVIDPGTDPAFFLEPANPPEWPQWWEASGYAVLAKYFSSAVTDLQARDERLGKVRMRMQENGITIRALAPDRYEEELDRIYEVSAVSFQENYLYTPLSRERFRMLYAKLRERIIPQLVLLAEQGGRPVGYVFSIPDYAEAARGEPTRTSIVKTLAVLPGRSFAGLGAVLLEEAHAAAHRLGFTRAIHALMHESNKSRNLSGHYGHTIRRYALYSKRL